MATEQPTQSRTGLIVAILVILGVAAGVALGLLLGWVVWPVEIVDTSISDLAPEYKEEYVLMVASAYACDGDLEKAQARLAQLEVPNVNGWISAQIDNCIVEGCDESDIQALAALADGLGVTSPNMLAYLATDTPVPTDTPLPTPTPLPTNTPTVTPLPPTDTPTSPPPTDTPTSLPTETAAPPTDTPKPAPTDTPKPAGPTNTPKPPPPTNTPQPTSPPADPWTWSTRLVGPGEDAQLCDGGGNLQIRVTALDAGGNQIGGVWLHDRYSGQYQMTGNVDSADWGPGETKFEYGIGGGGSLCIAQGDGGACTTGYTRDLPCYSRPPFEDMWAAGYCECCRSGISKEECRPLYDNRDSCMPEWGHFSWRVVYNRSW